MITRQAAVCAGLITSDIGGLANHDTTNGPALLALAVANFARRGVRASAISSTLVRRNVFRTCNAFAGAGLIPSHFLRATNLVACDPIAMAGGRHTNLGGCRWRWSALTESLKDLCTEIFSTRNRSTGAGFVARRLDGAIRLSASHSLASSGL